MRSAVESSKNIDLKNGPTSDAIEEIENAVEDAVVGAVATGGTGGSSTGATGSGVTGGATGSGATGGATDGTGSTGSTGSTGRSSTGTAENQFLETKTKTRLRRHR